MTWHSREDFPPWTSRISSQDGYTQPCLWRWRVPSQFEDLAATMSFHCTPLLITSYLGYQLWLCQSLPPRSVSNGRGLLPPPGTGHRGSISGEYGSPKTSCTMVLEPGDRAPRYALLHKMRLFWLCIQLLHTGFGDFT